MDNRTRHEDLGGISGDIEVAEIVTPRFARTRKIIGRTALAGALLFGTSTAIITAENPDLRDIVSGSVFDNGTRTPEIPGCENHLAVEDEPDDSEPDDSDPSDLTLPSTTTTTVAEETANIQSLKYDVASGVKKNSMLDLLNPKTYLDIKATYDSFFENKTGEYIDPYSGVEFHFFSQGNLEPAKYDPAAFARAMSLTIKHPLVMGGEGEVADVLDCAKTKVENGELEGKKVAIVIASDPYTCAGSFDVLHFDPEEEGRVQCKQYGLTMPEHDISFLGQNLTNTEYDTFVFLSNGGTNKKTATRQTIHELNGHLLFVLLGDKFGVDSDEAFAKYTDAQVSLSGLRPVVGDTYWYEGYEDDGELESDSILVLTDILQRLEQTSPFGEGRENVIITGFNPVNSTP